MSTESAVLCAYDLRTEHRATPLGIDERRPRFSWRLSSEAAGAAQTARRVRVETEPVLGGPGEVVWDSGWQEVSDGIAVEYDGLPLVPSTRYRWRVWVRDQEGRESQAGDSWFETGLLRGPDVVRWVRRIIQPDLAVDPPSLETPSDAVRKLLPAGYFRGVFAAGDGVVRARLHATAHGLYEPYLNGGRVGDHELSPGWTDYRDRVMYQTFDITDAIRPGANCVGAILGEGWWSGYYGADRRQQGYLWGYFPELWMHVAVNYADGRTEEFATDESWRYAYGPIQYTDLLMGEYADERRDLGDWSSPDYDAATWWPVEYRDSDGRPLVGMIDEPIRVMEEVPARSATTYDGAWIVDFGQNLSGRARFRFTEPAGTAIRIRYGEALDADGSLYTENLRTAEATDVYVSAGGTRVFEPRFTSHGFRYAELRGLSAPPDLAAITAVTLRNDIPWTGALTTSDPGINQLESNIRWGQRGNFVAVPTDCPQRDERLGWTADAQVFYATAAYNADVVAFLERWLRDVRYAQSDEGAFPDVAPKATILSEGAPAWADGGVIIPWGLYRVYGDRRILADSWDSVRRWIAFVARNNPDLIWRRRVGRNYGDWLQIDAATPRDVLATAYFARSASLAARIAGVLGEEVAAREHQELAARIRRAFREEFGRPEGRIEGDTQTAYLLALGFDLYPEAETSALAASLVRTIAEHDTSLTTGFIGIPLLCPVLSRIGRSDLAYALVRRTEYPSWQYSIGHGATTIWERWDGWTDGAGFQAPRMNSLNHYALGAVGEWLYRTMAGIDQEEDSAGFERIVIAPAIGGGLTQVASSFESVRGLIESRWARDGDHVRLEIAIPPGRSARVVAAAAVPGSVTLDGVVTSSGPDDGSVSLQAPAGRHVVEWRQPDAGTA